MTEKAPIASVSSQWFLYLLRCRDDSLYTGITTDIQRRFREHQDGGKKSAKSLRGKGPLQLVYTATLVDQSQALQAEYRIKQLPKPMKEQLVAGELTLGSLLSS